MNVLISIVVSVIVFISIIAIARFVRFALDQRLPAGIMPDIIGFAIVVGIMFAFITYGVVSGKAHGPQTAADAYVRLVKAETSEPKEIAEYRKQLYRELGAEILQRKKQIRIEAEENAKKMLAKYREQQTKAKLETEIAKSRELRLADINEILRESNERAGKSKVALGEIILLDDEPVEVKVRGKTMTFEKHGIYRF